MTPIAVGYERKDVYLGRTAEGRHVYIDVRFEEQNYTGPAVGRQVETTAHEMVPAEDVAVLAFTGTVSRRRLPTTDGWIEGMGQIDIRAVTRPADGLTRKDIEALAEIWSGWHLNTMSAACDHMDETIPADAVMETRYGLPDVTGWKIDHIVCSETGRRWGTRWWVRKVPDQVLTRLATILDRVPA